MQYLYQEFRATVVAEGFTNQDPSVLYSNTGAVLGTGGGLISYLNVSITSDNGMVTS